MTLVHEVSQSAERRVVWIGADSPAQLLTAAAQWLASVDGSVEVEAVTWVRLHHTPQNKYAEPAFELGIYFEVQE